MDGRKQSQLSGRGNVAAVAGVAWGLFLIAWGTGCSDHRMSLAEFIQLEQEMREASAPTTQPAATLRAAGELINRQLGPYKVGPRDVIIVSLTGLAQEAPYAPLQARVDRNGQIELPAVGPVQVADLELEDVEDAIQAAYVPKVFREVTVHVSLLEADTTNVLALGAVQTPGLVPLRRTERNLLFSIAGAGGASEAASGRVMLRRLRRPAEEVTLNLRDPEDLRAALALDPLEDGDMVKVEAATPNTIFVGGLVNAPGPRAFAPGVKMTLLQVVAASGGLRTDLTLREGTLIRRMPDGRDVQVKLDMDRLTVGKDPNITLAAGDILWIPHTVETRVQDWINRNVFFRMGATLTAGANYNASAFEYMNSNAKQRSGAGFGDGTLQDAFDPFGFLLQNQALQAIPTATVPPGP